MISEGYAEGWHARVDDTPAKIYRTDGEVMSVPVPAGKHTVVLSYWPVEFPIGMAASGAGIVITIGMLLGSRIARRRQARKNSTAALRARRPDDRPHE